MSNAPSQTITTDQAQALHFTNAITQTQAVIEFELDGTIITANDRFCEAFGYRLEEIQGQHHRMFLDGAEAASPGYRAFWTDLGAGHSREGEFRRITRSGEEIWMQASYHAVTDDQGKPYKIVKVASDITAHKKAVLESEEQAREVANQINGLSASQAMIEFDLLGNVIDANENFCKLFGYRLEEIRGQHHRMFCTPEYAASPEYRAFWADLGAGRFQAGEFRRVTRNGANLWILASYNPILDETGGAYKVVKLASDITAQKLRVLESEAEAQKVNEMMRQLPLNVMLVDKDLKLTYMNDSSRDTLRTLEHSLPVGVDNMIGTCIDVFHKDPSVQRRILGDPKRYLPHKAEFVIGGQDVELQADGVYDKNGEFLGCMASWSVITEKKRLEREAQEARERDREQATRLGQLLEEVGAGADQIDTGAQQIASASQSLSEGASQQASSLEEISSSLEQMSSMTERNADNCRQAATLSEECMRSGDKGQSEMGEMSDAMSEIKTSSAEISKIIKVIDEIAFQTNLLALNLSLIHI